MEDSLHDEYSEYIDPILSDKSIWANRIRFTQECKKLYSRLHYEGHSYQFISNVSIELFKRWEPLYSHFLNTEFRYEPDDEE